MKKEIETAYALKAQTERDLKACMDDLEAAIIENERLNSEKIVDNNDKTDLTAKNAELKRYVKARLNFQGFSIK